VEVIGYHFHLATGLVYHLEDDLPQPDLDRPASTRRRQFGPQMMWYLAE